MPNLARYLRGFGRRKPGPGTRIDWSHPLARGIVGCWLFNEGNIVAHDIARTTNLTTIVGAGTPPTAAPGLFGSPGIKTVSNGGGIGASSSPIADGPLSIVFWAAMVTPVTNQSRAVLNLYVSSGSGVGAVIGALSNGSANPGTDFLVGDSVGNTLSQNVFGATLAPGQPFQGAGTYSGTTLEVYMNGGQFYNNITGAQNTHTFTKTVACTNQQLFSGFVSMDGVTDHIFLYNRVISASEVFQLYQEPFAFLQQPAPKRAFSFTKVVPPVTGKFQPAWARRSPVIGVGVY